MAGSRKIVAKRRVESVRERADKQQARSDRQPRHRKVSTAAGRPVRGVRSFLSREYHLIKLPETKTGQLLTKKRSATPSYFVNSLRELKLVTWPTRRQALSLSMAVVVFSVAIAGFVQLLDYGLGKLFKEVILK
ncbi:MAG: preprotein translocase subunit SecE [Patescibacteria group bacterium]